MITYCCTHTISRPCILRRRRTRSRLIASSPCALVELSTLSKLSTLSPKAMWRAVGGSRVTLLPRFASPNNGGRFCPTRRILSSSASSPAVPSEVVKKAAKTLSWMSAQVSIHGEHAAQEWASRLSPSAQRELTGLMASSPDAVNMVYTVPEPSWRDLRLVAITQSIDRKSVV